MPAFTEGSAASAGALPRSALRKHVLRCAALLSHTASLAEIAATHGRPTQGARYLVETINDLQAELDAIKQHLVAVDPEEP